MSSEPSSTSRACVARGDRGGDAAEARWEYGPWTDGARSSAGGGLTGGGRDGQSGVGRDSAAGVALRATVGRVKQEMDARVASVSPTEPAPVGEMPALQTRLDDVVVAATARTDMPAEASEPSDEPTTTTETNAAPVEEERDAAVSTRVIGSLGAARRCLVDARDAASARPLRRCRWRVRRRGHAQAASDRARRLRLRPHARRRMRRGGAPTDDTERARAAALEPGAFGDVGATRSSGPSQPSRARRGCTSRWRAATYTKPTPRPSATWWSSSTTICGRTRARRRSAKAGACRTSACARGDGRVRARRGRQLRRCVSPTPRTARSRQLPIVAKLLQEMVSPEARIVLGFDRGGAFPSNSRRSATRASSS